MGNESAVIPHKYWKNIPQFYYLQVQCLLLVMKSRYISINYKLIYTVDDTVHKPVNRRNIANLKYQNCPMQERWSHLLVCPPPVIRTGISNIKQQIGTVAMVIAWFRDSTHCLDSRQV